MVFSPVHPFGFGGRFVYKFFSVEGSYKILSGTSSERTAGIQITKQHPLLFIRPFYRKFKQIGTFPYATMCALAFSETAFVRPVFQIGRRKNLHLLSYCQYHNPAPGFFMPKDFRVAEVTCIGCQYGIVLIAGESASVVGTVSNALYLPVAVLRINGDDSSRTETGSVIGIDNSRTAEDSSQCIGRNGYGEMLPVYEVFADSMSPAHISPFGAVRVILVEKVVFAILVYHSIGVVHPTVKR